MHGWGRETDLALSQLYHSREQALQIAGVLGELAEDTSVEDLVLPLVSYLVAGTGQRCPPFLCICGMEETWPWGHKSRRAGLVPPQGSTTGLALDVGVG